MSIQLSPKILRILMALGGFLFIFFALAADILRLSRSIGFGRGQSLLMLAGIVLVIFGFLFRNEDFSNLNTIGLRIGDLYRGFGLILLNTLVLLLLIEWSAPSISRFIDKKSAAISPSTRVQMDWEKAFAQEYRASNRAQYHPYTLWRNIPYKGTVLQVGETGQRTTPGTECEDGAYKVFVFGGSAIWGYGAPDWSTIPAYLQVGMSRKMDRLVCIINFGQKGYVSTQELVELTLQLQKGNVPDLVIFYDGSNDIWASYNESSSLAPPHVDQTRIKTTLENPVLGWLIQTETFKLLSRLIGSPPETDIEVLTNQITKNYLGVYQIVNALANNYQFEYHFFIQPVIFTGNKPLTNDEVAISAVHALEFQELYRTVYASMEDHQSESPHLILLKDLFNQTRMDIYTDWVHILPAGNEMVAQAILDEIFNYE